jgi:outer membrane immunogenic protein
VRKHSIRGLGLLPVLTGAVLISAPALGADLAARPYTKAPPMMVQAYNWTGFYLGVNAGVGLGRSPAQLATTAGTFETTRLSPFGAIGGAQVGYNWQTSNFMGFGNVVFGIEADIQAAGLKDDRTCILLCVAGGPSATIENKIDWFGTVRGRVGLATGSVLTYFTGGLAYGSVKTNITETVAGTATGIGMSGTRTGWTIGSGVEAALGGNWTGKIEYLYVDLGKQDATYVLTGVGHAYTSDIRQHIFRAGVNYRFGGGLNAPEPVANWNGLYLGANIGSATARNESSLQAGLVTERFNLSPDGYIGGLQMGYNWQAANWVWGLETDIQGSTQRENRGCLLSCSPAAFALMNQQMQWFGTVRGRVGYAVGQSLFYATGGFAYGDVKTGISEGLGGVPFNIEFSKVRTGYAVGGGIETPFDIFGLFGKNWTSKTEYLYVDLGKSSNSYAFNGVAHTFETKVQEHIFRTGLNYHFNTPISARY